MDGFDIWYTLHDIFGQQWAITFAIWTAHLNPGCSSIVLEHEAQLLIRNKISSFKIYNISLHSHVPGNRWHKITSSNRKRIIASWESLTCEYKTFKTVYFTSNRRFLFHSMFITPSLIYLNARDRRLPVSKTYCSEIWKFVYVKFCAFSVWCFPVTRPRYNVSDCKPQPSPWTKVRNSQVAKVSQRR
jgi:hypothetical protein